MHFLAETYKDTQNSRPVSENDATDCIVSSTTGQTPQKRPRQDDSVARKQIYPIFSSGSSSKQTTIVPVTPAEPLDESKPTPEFKPLAEKMRPSSLDEFIGQSGVLGDQSLLRQLITSNRIPSMILWGPPGCGKVGILWSTSNSST
ncbi:hypothetical protein HPB51_010915 [Rhipicephalus microplus]|uniref:Uncharacterized protein n=1 Tax=Rhipicephalus microplus TaxID=6941 RepID=A0A9J6D504_RHIMP|nr:hypothetical protein HPB51_010915 [Rhipicephalus microplus]